MVEGYQRIEPEERKILLWYHRQVLKYLDEAEREPAL
jgi:hypothetical protein